MEDKFIEIHPLMKSPTAFHLVAMLSSDTAILRNFADNHTSADVNAADIEGDIYGMTWETYSPLVGMTSLTKREQIPERCDESVDLILGVKHSYAISGSCPGTTNRHFEKYKDPIFPWRNYES